MRTGTATILVTALWLSAVAGCANDPNAGRPGGSSSDPAMIASRFTPRVLHKHSAKDLGPDFVSPSTQSIEVAINGGVPEVTNLTPSSPDCTPPSQNEPLECTVPVVAPPGNDRFTATTYDEPGA